MTQLLDGDDGLPAEEVGVWAKDKHAHLCRYVDISRAARAKFVGAEKGGTAYIDLFCGPGRALVRDTGEWIDGSPVVAWKKSIEVGAPFTRVIIADADVGRLRAAEARLHSLGAPVIALSGSALDTASEALRWAPPHGLNFAFLDPYNIESLDFAIFQSLARLKRIDILVHVNKMDLQRNLGFNVATEQSRFEKFAPGWREKVDLKQPYPAIRRDLLEYWRQLVAGTGIATSEETKLITGTRGQHLYWLLLAAKHELAHKFWRATTKGNQGDFDF